ncbi:Isoaspartyl aminopeptidase [Acidisarcina polymorpha]|uniref:Isoaspartyl peptidase n=1 Tax=Acidisarcina polymorpha TaxID=2211140 RepID=A0A2Z5FVD3_9BACT|nr:isoaspartyl peptidase/L-asparaginase [Acidisarcina polymorpha]AXC10712.1 Isoaspartyl aminopeptidase [Acidisarcina polymorpha]
MRVLLHAVTAVCLIGYGSNLQGQAVSSQAAPLPPAMKWAIAIHGGAGETEWEHMDAATAAAYHASLDRALAAGVDKLSHGGKALDAVEAAIIVLEDDPLFNAGRGAAFNSEGKNEMDASIMDGATLEAGSVAGVRFTKNPISLARAVMEKTPYVMVAGPGADAFATSIHLPQMPASYFFTEARWQELLQVLRAGGRPLPPRPAGVPPEHQGHASLSLPSSFSQLRPFAHKYGTVGVVARDIHGDLAAGTSTGGLQGKMPGRVGDSPVIGAGTYAANHACAVSSTGVGEYFIRLSVAKEICVLVEYKGLSIQEAADQVIRHEVAALKGGEGGVIVLDAKSDPVWSFNTLGMFRARQVEGGEPVVEVGK